jgi:hypothetical protein
MAVSRSQTPDFESVRARVETDARRLAAFERLVADKQTWLDRVSQTSLEDVAEKQGTTVRESAPFQRRQPGIFELQVPDVPGVGRDESFVDRVFEIAAASPTLALPPAAGADESVPKPDRPIEAIGVKRQLSLVLVRISQYTPVARTTYDSITSRPELALLVRPYLGDTFDADPLSFDALKQRLQYEEEP